MGDVILGRVSRKSAYEIAVEKGYTGTETEWIKNLESKGYTEEEIKAFAKSEVEDYLTKNPSSGGTVTSSYFDRPDDGVVHFTTKVNTNFSDVYSTTNCTQDKEIVKEDQSILFLPTNYDKSGDPIRLIINCHGAGTTITKDTTELAQPVGNMVKLGYAVLDTNGVPEEDTGLHYGNPVAVQAYIKAYQYVVKHYNIKKECFIMAVSMGGLTSNALVYSGCIPIIAQAGFSLILDFVKNVWFLPWDGSEQRKKVCTRFNLSVFNKFSSNKQASLDEINYIISNLDRISGYNPMTSGAINTDSTGIYSNFVGLNSATESTEKTAYDKLIKIHPVPVKLWHCIAEVTAYYKYAKYFINAIKRGGGKAELRSFPIQDGVDNHNSRDRGKTVQFTDVDETSFNGTTSTYELYEWFKRFDSDCLDTTVTFASDDKYDVEISTTDYYAITDVSDCTKYVNGHYGATGEYTSSDAVAPYRVCVSKLVKVKPNTTYTANILYNESTPTYKFVIRSYDASGTFVSSIGAKADGETIDIPSNIEYISVAIYESTASVPNSTILSNLVSGSLSVSITE